MTDLQKALIHELNDIRMSAGRVERLLSPELPARDLAHALVALEKLPAGLDEIGDRLELHLVSAEDMPT
jgi:hypothetical protein